MDKPLTEHERNLSQRFRSALFDADDEVTADGVSLLDPEHPETPGLMWLIFPPRKPRKPKAPPVADQTRMEL